jgi:hypothetical protein
MKMWNPLIKKALMALFFTIAPLICPAQGRVQNSGFWDMVHYGGGVGIGFGTDYFNAAISPTAIYQVNPYFGVGAGLVFNYSKIHESTLLAYGTNLPVFFNPIDPLQLSVEFEQLWVHRDYGFDGADIQGNYWLPALFLGIGYSRNGLTVGLRYDALHDRDRSIYYGPLTPFIRLYF